MCFDELNENDSLSLEEIDTALTSIYDKMTDKFAFIGFDACLMATVETANMLVPHADYMFASEETEPGYGWDYTEIAGFMESNPTAIQQNLERRSLTALWHRARLSAQAARLRFR